MDENIRQLIESYRLELKELNENLPTNGSIEKKFQHQVVLGTTLGKLLGCLQTLEALGLGLQDYGNRENLEKYLQEQFEETTKRF